MQQVPEPGMSSTRGGSNASGGPVSGGPVSGGPVPQRIGDAERDAAVDRLRTAHAEGRITAEEFDERMEAALRARTAADLAPLFVDLPPASTGTPGLGTTAMTAYAAQPSTLSTGASREVSTGAKVWWSLYSVLWPVFIVVCMVTHQWGLMAIPALLGPVVFGGSRRQNAQARRELHHEYRQRRRELRGR